MTDSSQSELHLFMTSSSSSSQSTSSAPSCLKWALKLSNLLEDHDGVQLFHQFVDGEGSIHRDRLKFYFACEGLKQQSDPTQVKVLVKAINRFVKHSQLPVPSETAQIIKAGLKDEFILTPDLFDQMQQNIEKLISETTYRNFLQSEIYLQHVQAVQSAMQQSGGGSTSSSMLLPSSTATSSNTISETSSKFMSRSSTLPTLHEEGGIAEATGGAEAAEGGNSEAASNRVPISGSTTSSKVPMSLTKDALMATQRRRLEMRPPGYVVAANHP